jgi:hypothetical protein
LDRRHSSASVGQFGRFAGNVANFRNQEKRLKDEFRVMTRNPAKQAAGSTFEHAPGSFAGVDPVRSSCSPDVLYCAVQYSG